MRIFKGSIGGTGGGTIGGSVGATQVAFGSGVNTVNGNANFTWDNTLKILHIIGNLDLTGSMKKLSIDDGGANDAYIDSANGVSAGVSAAGHARLRYNNTTHTWQASINSGGYVDLGASGVDLVTCTLATANGATAATVVDSAGIFFNIPISGADATPHEWSFGVAGTKVFKVTATGNGAGGITGADVTVTGKLTVTGAIDPTSLSLDAGGSIDAFIDSANGFSAGLSAANHGRIRYNNTTKTWEGSVDGGAYQAFGTATSIDLVTATLATASGATAATTNNSAGVTFNIPVTGADATAHAWTFNIDGNSIFKVSATGDGGGGIVSKAVTIDGTIKTPDGTAPGGDATDFVFTPGVGGAANGVFAGGIGGDFRVASGIGGVASATLAGGAGGALVLAGGAGGAGTAGAASGAGGSMTFTAGAPGANGGGGLGVYGSLSFVSNATSFTIANAGITGALPDNVANAFVAKEGANDYIHIITSNGTESVGFGNTTTNPTYNFFGSGLFRVGGVAEFDNRILGAAGTAVSNNDLTLGAGNLIYVSGNTDIHAIATSGWTSGSVVYLLFAGALTVKHNTAGGAGTAPILLDGGLDILTAGNTVLTLVYDGTAIAWQQVALKGA